MMIVSSNELKKTLNEVSGDLFVTKNIAAFTTTDWRKNIETSLWSLKLKTEDSEEEENKLAINSWS